MCGCGPSPRTTCRSSLPLVTALRTDPELCGPFLWEGWRDPRRFRRRWEDDGWLGADTAALMVARGGDALGLVSASSATSSPPPDPR